MAESDTTTSSQGGELIPATGPGGCMHPLPMLCAQSCWEVRAKVAEAEVADTLRAMRQAIQEVEAAEAEVARLLVERDGLLLTAEEYRLEVDRLREAAAAFVAHHGYQISGTTWGVPAIDDFLVMLRPSRP